MNHLTQDNNLLITGLPRSGTSLLLSLLASGGSLCFSEPPWLKTLRENSENGQQLVDLLEQQISQLRERIANGKAIDMVFKQGTDQPPDNYFDGNHKLRRSTREIRPVLLPTNSSRDRFIIKANALFTANLTQLAAHEHWRIKAIVRDPLAVIMSWRSVNIASSHARLKKLEKYDFRLQQISQQEPLLKRQVLLLDWYFSQFNQLPSNDLIYYESLVQSPAHTLQQQLGQNITTATNLVSKNHNQQYDHSEQQKITAALQEYGDALKQHYPAYA
jgi:hypothetical protein